MRLSFLVLCRMLGWNHHIIKAKLSGELYKLSVKMTHTNDVYIR